MNREYKKWFSTSLQRDMELLIFGHAGLPALVFPSSKGRFYDYEDRGMIAALAQPLENGTMQAFCADSVDAESWYNTAIHPRDRVRRHLQYERYVLQEIIAFIRSRNQDSRLALTGCSFGGYHAMNFALRHPNVVTEAVSLGAAFDIHQFLDGYYDEDCYFNCPPDYLPNLRDEWYLGRYRNSMRLVMATGERDNCLEENLRLGRIMDSKQIPHTLEVWGDGAGHGWSWWQNMARTFLG